MAKTAEGAAAAAWRRRQAQRCARHRNIAHLSIKRACLFYLLLNAAPYGDSATNAFRCGVRGRRRGTQHQQTSHEKHQNDDRQLFMASAAAARRCGGRRRGTEQR